MIMSVTTGIELGLLKAELEALKTSSVSLISEAETPTPEPFTWELEDERLKVTSQLITEYAWGEVWYYIVMVNVTNVSDEPIEYVWVLLVPCKNGRVLGEYIGASCYTIDGLYIGETDSHELVVNSPEMTSYRLFVAGS